MMDVLNIKRDTILVLMRELGYDERRIEDVLYYMLDVRKIQQPLSNQQPRINAEPTMTIPAKGQKVQSASLTAQKNSSQAQKILNAQKAPRVASEKQLAYRAYIKENLPGIKAEIEKEGKIAKNRISAEAMKRVASAWSSRALESE